MDWGEYPDPGPTKNEAEWIRLAKEYKAQLDQLRAENERLKLVAINAYADGILQAASDAALFAKALADVRERFAGMYTKVGNVRAWQGNADDIDGLIAIIDAALSDGKGEP